MTTLTSMYAKVIATTADDYWSLESIVEQVLTFAMFL